MMIQIADLHCDTVLEIQGGANLAEGCPEGHVDIPRLREGHVGLAIFACFIPGVYPEGRAFAETIDLLDLLDETCGKFSRDLVRVETASEVEIALEQDRIGIMAAVENGHAIERNLSNLDALRRRGVRYLTMTHARHLPWAASSGEAGDGPGGLTSFGREVVRALNDLQIIPDISHAHEKTFWDVVRTSRRPVIASHSCASALCPLARNLTDDQLRAIRDTGGMVGVNFYPGFLDPGYFGRHGGSLDRLFADLERTEREFMDDPAARQREIHRAARETRERQGEPDADLDRVCDHVEHIVKIAGEDHVGIGSDFDGLPDLPRGVTGCDAFPRLIERLRARGIAAGAIEKIARLNALRVLRNSEA